MREVGPQDGMPPITGNVVQHALNAVLTYHHGESSSSSNLPGTRLVESINPFLTKRFFDDLFVLRPQVRAALRLMTIEPMTIIHGSRGAGKTTIVKFIQEVLQKPTWFRDLAGEDRGLYGADGAKADLNDLVVLAEQIPQDPDWYFYFDVEHHRGRLSDKITVCECLFDIIKERCKDTLDSFDTDWQSYLDASFGPIREERTRAAEVANQLNNLLTENAMSKALIEKLMNDLSKAYALFDAATGQTKLRHLLEYLTTKRKITPGVALDNIDLFDNSVQYQIVRDLFDLTYNSKLLHHSVIGVRSEHLDTIANALKGWGGFRVDDAIDCSVSERDFQLVIALIERRLRLLPEILNLPEVQATLASQEASGYLPATDPTVTERDKVVEVLKGLLSPTKDRPAGYRNGEGSERNYFAQLLQFHNNSLRSVAGTVYNLALAVSSNSDPVYSFADIKSRVLGVDRPRPELTFGRTVGNRIRFSRCFFLRQSVTNRVSSLDFNHNLLIFEKPDKPVATSDLPYLRMHVLASLHEFGSVPFRSLSNTFEDFRVQESRLRAALISLAERIGTDDRGLVEVVGAKYRRRPLQAEDIKKDTELRILPAGQLLMTRMAYMTDYTFWNAYNANNRHEIFDVPDHELIEPRLLASEDFRIESAMRYVERRVMPRFIDVYRRRIGVSRRLAKLPADEYLIHYLDRFGSSMVPVKLSKEIADFARKGPTLSDQFKTDIGRRARLIEGMCEAPFAEARLISRIPRR